MASEPSRPCARVLLGLLLDPRTAVGGRVAAQQPARQAQPCPGPQVYLVTVRRADELVHLFILNDRSRRVVQALKASTLASQACRLSRAGARRHDRSLVLAQLSSAAA